MQKILLTKGFALYFKTAKKPGNLYMPQKLAQIVQLNGTHFDKSVLTDSSTRNKYNNISNNICTSHIFKYIKFFFLRLERVSWVVSGKESPTAKQDMWVQSLGWEDPGEKEMATHSSILGWRIPWTEELGSLYSMVIRHKLGSKQQQRLEKSYIFSETHTVLCGKSKGKQDNKLTRDEFMQCFFIC